MLRLLTILLTLTATHAQGLLINPYVFGTGGTAPPGITNDIINYWRLDEVSGTRTDVIAGRNLTDNNTAPGVAGKITNAVECVFANTEYLDWTGGGAAPPDIDGSSAASFTFVFWFKLYSLGATHYIGNNFNNVSGDQWILNIRTDDKLLFGIQSGGTYRTVTNSTTLATNVWYFGYVARNGTNDLLYASINDGAVDSATDGNINAVVGGNFRLGNYVAAGGFQFDGQIDEFGVWGRALATNEVTWLYNTGTGRTYPFQ